MNYSRMFKIKFLGPTNTKGSRLKITDTRHNESITLSKSYTFNSILDQACEYLQNKGINITSVSEDSNTYYLTSDNFDIHLK